jgi:pyruvate dehydrogenase E2 component (dihydrolipoamide acetyltransferase)
MDGTLLNWTKNVGDAVKQGDVIAEIESDKATVEIEAPANGVLASVSAQPGDSLTTGVVIAVIGEAGEAAPAAASAQQTTAVAPKVPPVSTPAPAKSNGAPHAAATTEDGHIKASPLARKLAEEKGVDLNAVHGTGPGGRIVKEDVESFQGGAPVQPAALTQTAPASAPAAAGFQPVPARKLPEGADVEVVDITTLRKRIIAVTVESKQQIPHFYVTNEMDMDALLALRAQLNASLPEGAAKISVNDMVVKATALALRNFPNLNSHAYGDKLVRHKRINIGIAVALPNGGLMYVVAHDADKVALGTLAQQNKDRIARARDGKVKPEDISGATFSTSNLGAYDVDSFSAIINPPESGILAVGTAAKVPVVKPDGTLGVGNRMKVTISVDHRVSDGAEGAQFLQTFKTIIENPMRLVI